MGNYASVLLTLNLESDLKLIAKDDELGRKLQDAHLPTKMRTRVSHARKLKKNTNE